ncbi:MAG: hypothetical protein Q9190_007836 [Brigantiaea leucoxantha]
MATSVDESIKDSKDIPFRPTGSSTLETGFLSQLDAEVEKQVENHPEYDSRCWPTTRNVEISEAEKAEFQRQLPRLPENLKDFTDEECEEFLNNPPGSEDVGGLSDAALENFYERKKKYYYPAVRAMMSLSISKGTDLETMHSSSSPTDPMPQQQSPELTRLDILKRDYGPEAGQFLDDNWDTVCDNDKKPGLCASK